MFRRVQVVPVMILLASVAALGAWTQVRTMPDRSPDGITQPYGVHKMITGGDLGFQIEGYDRTGAPIGRLMLRIDDRWVPARFAVAFSKATP